jgi:ribosomal protection tetracycline resistance protein
MSTLNLGILAHVDAGKTSLTERLLFAAGAIDAIGSVDGGDTQTDTLALERQRGITIKSAVASFALNSKELERVAGGKPLRTFPQPARGDLTINLIDTPGHPDFIAEVERVLNVLDGAVLVISAVEGVQAQTRVLMRTLQRLGIPTLIFVNKIDRAGARYDGLLAAITERLTPAVVAMGSTLDLGSRQAGFAPFNAADVGFRARLTEVLADHDEGLLNAFVDGQAPVAFRRLRKALACQTGRAQVHPIFFGSAITGAGVEALMAGIAELLPASRGDVQGPVSGAVFKVERGPAGEKIAYVRMFSGTARTRERLAFGDGREAKVTAIRVFDRGPAVPRESVEAGQIGKLWGLGEVQIGDAVGERRAAAPSHYFAPPTLETLVVPRRAADRGALLAALSQLAEQDPLINLRQDDIRQEIFVSLYGEVQKEVIQKTLATDFGLEVEFRETTIICVERPVGTGAAFDAAPRPFIATLGLRIDPAPVDTGLTFRLEIEFGSLPLSFHEAIEDSVRDTLRQGLHGWPVTDCIVTMTDAIRLRKWATSTAAEHRKLAPLVVMAALKQAGTVVCEPIQHFHLEGPGDALPAILPVLARLRAEPGAPTMRGSSLTLEGEIRAARAHELQLELPALTSGEGVLEFAFDHYKPVSGPPPTRARTDHNPLDRKNYMLSLARRGR